MKSLDKLSKSKKFQRVMFFLFAAMFVLPASVNSQAAFEQIEIQAPPLSAAEANFHRSNINSQSSIDSIGAANAELGIFPTVLGVGERVFSDPCWFMTYNGGERFITQTNIIAAENPGAPSYFTGKCDNNTISMVDAALEGAQLLYNQKPASAVLAMEETFARLTSPDEVAAQYVEAYFPGTGFELLRPVQAFWGWSVTVAYSLMIVIIIGIAIALLFQGRLGGGQAVQLQNALPNIVLAMVLIPLSYPITGLFIDGITLGSNIVWGAFFSDSGFARKVWLEGEYNGENLGVNGNQEVDFSEGRGLYIDDPRITPFNARGAFINQADFSTLFASNDKSIQCVVVPEGVTLDSSSPVTTSCEDAVASSSMVNSLTDGVLSGLNQISGLLAIIIKIAIAVVTIVTAIKIILRLLRQYINLLLYPVIAPFIFMTIAIPGNGTKTILQFIKTLGAVTTIFVVTYAMILLTIVLSNGAFMEAIPGFAHTQYAPPLLGFGVGDASINNRFIFSIIAIAIYLSIPSTIDSIDKALGGGGGIPGFITRPFEEFKAGGRVAFRAAGMGYGVSRRGVTTGIRAGQGVGNAYNASRARYGAQLTDPNDIFSPTVADKRKEDIKEQVKKLRKQAEQETNPVRKRMLTNRANMIASEGEREVSRLMGGKSPGLAPKSGDPKKMKIKASVIINGIGENKPVYHLSNSSNATGELLIEKDTDADNMNGLLQIKTGSQPGVIAELKPVDSGDSLFLRIVGKLEGDTNPKQTVSSKDKLKFSVEICKMTSTNGLQRITFTESKYNENLKESDMPIGIEYKGEVEVKLQTDPDKIIQSAKTTIKIIRDRK